MHVQLSPSNGVNDWTSNFHGTQVVIIYGGTGTMYNTLIATLLTAYSNAKRISDLDFSVQGTGVGSLNNQWSINAFKVID
jgi:hypothetical protein